MNKILRPLFRSTNNSPFKEFIRLKGHSKWQNIKHTKAKQDSEKSAMIMRYLRQIRAAIAANGEANPNKNLKLSYWIDEAKKKQVPNGTITAYLEKFQRTKTKDHNFHISVQGPDGSFFIFQLVTDNLATTKITINHHVKKCMCKLTDGSINSVFNQEGHILMEKTIDIDAATDVAIEVGAEDVSEIEQDDKIYLKFTCNPLHLMVVKNNLLKKGFIIKSAEEQFVPHSLVEISDEGIDVVTKLIDRMRSMEEFVQAYDNIA